MCCLLTSHNEALTTWGLDKKIFIFSLQQNLNPNWCFRLNKSDLFSVWKPWCSCMEPQQWQCADFVSSLCEKSLKDWLITFPLISHQSKLFFPTHSELLRQYQCSIWMINTTCKGCCLVHQPPLFSFLFAFLRPNNWRLKVKGQNFVFHCTFYFTYYLTTVFTDIYLLIFLTYKCVFKFRVTILAHVCWFLFHIRVVGVSHDALCSCSL